MLTSELLTKKAGQSFRLRQVVDDIGLTNDAFVASILAQDVYAKPTASVGELICEFPAVKQRTLLGAFVADNSFQSYFYGLFRLWLKESVLGSFERGYASEAENCGSPETRTALSMDHAEQSLAEGNLSETVRLT